VARSDETVESSVMKMHLLQFHIFFSVRSETMGGKNGIHKLVASCKQFRPFTAQNGDFALIDVSCIMYYIHWEMRNRLKVSPIFWLDPVTDESSINDHVTMYSNLLINTVYKYRKPGQVGYILVFEGSPAKASSAQRMKARAGPLGNAIRAFFRARTDEERDQANSTIACRMGRPPCWFVEKVCERLSNQGVSVSFHRTEQSDARIVALARKAKEKKIAKRVIVVSSDYDFLTLAPPKTIDAIYDHKQQCLVEKNSILSLLKSRFSPAVDEASIFLAYCVGGCDDVETNLKGTGFSRAMERTLATKIKIHCSQASFVKAYNGMGSETELKSLYSEIDGLWADYWNKSPPIIASPQILPVSMVQHFLTEKDDKDKYRRPGLRKKWLSFQEGMAEVHPRATKTRSEQMRIEIGKKKVVQFTTNYSVARDFSIGALADSPGLISSKTIEPKKPRHAKQPKPRPADQQTVLDARDALEVANNDLRLAPPGEFDRLRDLKRKREEELKQAKEQCDKIPRILGPVKSAKFELIRRYNPGTISLGSLSKYLNSVILEDDEFRLVTSWLKWSGRGMLR
jgi:hypothetical protein